MSGTANIDFFVSCPPGLEKLLATEMRAKSLAIPPAPAKEIPAEATLTGEDTGGLLLRGTLADVYTVNLVSQLASRVIVRLGTFYSASFSELRKKASRLPWEKYLRAGQQVSLRVTCHRSKLYHSGAVAERVLGAINDCFARFNKASAPCQEAKTGQLVLVRMENDQCTISIDSSGEPLYKRGYKLAVAKAPLHENIAAAMLYFSCWDGVQPLIDPFCGSGTIPIEAAIHSRGTFPGIKRRFQFMEWPCFNQDIWQQISDGNTQEAMNSGPIFGYDRDAGAIQMASDNARRWDTASNIHFANQAVSYLECPAPQGTIITNPPYGLRIRENKDLRNLYARFGSILKSKFNGWTVVLLSPDDRLTANLGLGDPSDVLSFKNGGIPVKMLKFQL